MEQPLPPPLRRSSMIPPSSRRADSLPNMNPYQQETAEKTPANATVCRSVIFFAAGIAGTRGAEAAKRGREPGGGGCVGFPGRRSPARGVCLLLGLRPTGRPCVGPIGLPLRFGPSAGPTSPQDWDYLFFLFFFSGKFFYSSF